MRQAKILSTPAAQIIHDGLPLLFLCLAGAVTLLVFARAVAVMVGLRAPRAPKDAARR